MQLQTAAAYLDMSPSTLKVLVPVLAAHYGLRVYRVAGPKISRENLDNVLLKLAVDGKDIVVRKAAREIQIGEKMYPIKPARHGRRVP